jgi:hypothetical protein
MDVSALPETRNLKPKKTYALNSETNEAAVIDGRKCLVSICVRSPV